MSVPTAQIEDPLGRLRKLVKRRRIAQSSKEQMAPAVTIGTVGLAPSGRAGSHWQHVLVEGLALVVPRVRGSFT